MNIFDINFVVLKILNYPLSLVELIGTITGMLSVYLTTREKISCWPIGIFNILCFLVLFYQVQLYSDMLLQLYFLVMSVYGWWQWTHPRSPGHADNNQQLKISDLPGKGFWLTIGISTVAVILLGAFISRIHIYLPALFPVPAALPYPDAFTTVFSITATILMTRKKRQCWLLWILVDIAAVVIYFIKGINLIAIEYIIFGIIAVNGYLGWSRQQKAYMTIKEEFYADGISTR